MFVVMMTSLSMIMLAFFIVLNTMATITQIKVMKALDSLYGSFGPLSGGKSVEPGPLSVKENETEEKKPTKEKVYKTMLQRANLDPSIELLERDDSFTLALQDDVLFETGQSFRGFILTATRSLGPLSFPEVRVWSRLRISIAQK